MENIFINKESNFKNETVKTSHNKGGSNINLSTDNKHRRKESIIPIKPKLSSSNTSKMFIAQKKSDSIKPFAKKIPLDSFGAFANNKLSTSSSGSGSSSGEEETSDSGSSENSDESSGNPILSNGGMSSHHSSSSYSNESSSDHSSNIRDKRHKKHKHNKHKRREVSETSGSYTSNGSDDTDDDDDSDEDDSDEDDSDEDSEDDSDEDSEDDSDNTSSGNTSNSGSVAPRKSYEEIQKEKQQFLFKLDRLNKQGYPPSKRYSMASSYDELKFECDRLKKQRDVEKSVSFCRQGLIGFTSGAEYLNKTYDPFDIKLNGWSENVMENISNYDEVFEELYEMYGEQIKMHPILKLVSMVGGSALMFHISKSFSSSKNLDVDEIIKKNPDVARAIREAQLKQVSSNISASMPVNNPIGNMMNTGINSMLNRPSQQPQRPPQQSLSQQPTLRGPSDIDDLFNELNRGGPSNNNRLDELSIDSRNETSSIVRAKGRGKNKNNGGLQLNF